jgi:hypothetical protein
MIILDLHRYLNVIDFLPLGGSSKQTGHSSRSFALPDKFSLKNSKGYVIKDQSHKRKVKKEKGKIDLKVYLVIKIMNPSIQRLNKIKIENKN